MRLRPAIITLCIIALIAFYAGDLWQRHIDNGICASIGGTRDADHRYICAIENPVGN